MTALTVYLDDSGSDEANPRQIVAGFGSSVEQWRRFDREWLNVREEFNVSCFKAKEFNDGLKGFGQYENWTKKRRTEFLDRLLGIIARRAFKSFSSSLMKSAYDSVIAPSETLRNYFYTPFAFSVINCVRAACEWRDELYPGEPILFIFDRGHKNEGQLRNIGKSLSSCNDHLIEDIRPDDDKQSQPLQAADLLVFEMCLEERNAQSKATLYSRYPLIRLSDLPHDWLRVDEEHLLDRTTKLISDGTFRLSPARAFNYIQD